MPNNLFKKMLVIGILMLFVGTGIFPSISGDYDSEKDFNKLVFYTFDKYGMRECEVDVSSDVASVISDRFDVLKDKVVSDPYSVETCVLKSDFVDLLDSYGLIPEGLSRDDVFSLLDPWWLGLVENSRFFGNVVSGSGVRDNILPGPFPSVGSAFFCGVAGYGAGFMFMPVMLPRPRLASMWSSFIYASSYAANLLTGHGFIADGAQIGTAVGFTGVGLSFVYPGFPAVFSFYGYALFTSVQAEHVEHYPPNEKPVISEEIPSDGVWDVPVSLSELSFRISDPDRDRMSYSVTTYPDIGSGSGNNVAGGTYSVPVSGLEVDKIYSWTVSVSDGEDSVEKSFGFITEGRPPFDPFDDGWGYRKKITINHTKVVGDLSGFPVLVSLVDPDLAVKAQGDGDDVLFMDGLGVASKLYHEVESYDSSSGELVAWVNLPSLSSGVDSVLYLYYGNPGCGGQEFAERVWDSDFCGVWHLDDFGDSSLNGNDGGNHGTDDCIGKIGDCKSFSRANSDYISWGDMQEPSNNKITTATFEMWVNPEDILDVSNSLINKANTGDYEPDKLSYGFSINAERKIHCALFSGTWYSSGNKMYFVTNDPLLVTGNWQHISITINLMDKSARIFYNGEEKENTREIIGTPPSYFYNINYPEESGRLVWEGATRKYDGAMDELRISKICRSEEWIITQYNNQNDPSMFLSIGPEES